MKPNSSPSAHAPLRVLIVEDVPQVRQALSLLLELSGELEIAGEASNGQEAVARVEALLPDVILMDLRMPVMDGYEAARLIKSRWPTCRVIAFSIHGDEVTRQKARRAGIDGFLEKGAPVAAILQAITNK
ncbi:MAG TPA: response regulator transcription factor [Anaerolineaceae bacterium]